MLGELLTSLLPHAQVTHPRPNHTPPPHPAHFPRFPTRPCHTFPSSLPVPQTYRPRGLPWHGSPKPCSGRRGPSSRPPPARPPRPRSPHNPQRPPLFRILLLIPLSLSPSSRADTLSLTPDADNTLYEDIAGSQSNGVGHYLFSGNTLMSSKRRALLHFNLSSLPENATITAATITLTMSRGGSSPIPFSLHRATRAWGESSSDAENEEGIGAPIQTGDAGWLHSIYPATRWSTPGGDFLESPSTIALVSDLGPHTWPSTPTLISDLADMRANPNSNFGFLLLGDEFSNPPTAKRFNSRENPDAATRPTLTITYSIPTPTTLAPIALAALHATRRRRASR